MPRHLQPHTHTQMHTHTDAKWNIAVSCGRIKNASAAHSPASLSPFPADQALTRHTLNMTNMAVVCRLSGLTLYPGRGTAVCEFTHIAICSCPRARPRPCESCSSSSCFHLSCHLGWPLLSRCCCGHLAVSHLVARPWHMAHIFRFRRLAPCRHTCPWAIKTIKTCIKQTFALVFGSVRAVPAGSLPGQLQQQQHMLLRCHAATVSPALPGCTCGQHVVCVIFHMALAFNIYEKCCLLFGSTCRGLCVCVCVAGLSVAIGAFN